MPLDNLQPAHMSFLERLKSITFAISAAATDPDLNVAARIYANAYGRDIVNTTIYLCDYLQGVLCPLPMINFTGWGTYPIPDEFIREIPSLAWTVPNLEAFARVTLLDNKNGETSACLQATLYNDLSTEQRAVKWVSGGIFIFALLVAFVHTTLRYSPSPAVYRWYDLLYLFQSAAISGLLEINYPLMYIKFVLNFHWAIGLFYDKNIQQAIVKMRNKTGAKLATVALQALDYTNRKLSPYNERYRRDILPVPDYDWHSNVSVEHYDTFSTMMSPINFNTVSSSIVQVGQPIDTPVYSFAKRADIPTVDAKDVVVKNGLPVFTNSLGIPPGNAFATIFIIYMISICVFIGAHILWGLIVFGVDRFRKVENRGQGWLGEQKRGFWSFCLGNLMRLCLIFLFPIFVFALYQFDIGKGDSWLCILLSVLSLAWTVIGLSAVLIYACLRARPKNNQLPETSSLYTDYSWYNSAGMIYRQYRPKYHFWWYAPLAVATFVKACFVAFANGNPWAQVCGLIVVEFLVVVTCIGFRPHKDKKGDWLGAVLGLLRMVAFGLMIAFIPSMDVDPIVRTVLGFVILALFSIPVVLLFFGLLFNLGECLVFVFADCAINVFADHNHVRLFHHVVQPMDTLSEGIRGDWKMGPRSNGATRSTTIWFKREAMGSITDCPRRDQTSLEPQAVSSRMTAPTCRQGWIQMFEGRLSTRPSMAKTNLGFKGNLMATWITHHPEPIIFPTPMVLRLNNPVSPSITLNPMVCIHRQWKTLRMYMATIQ